MLSLRVRLVFTFLCLIVQNCTVPMSTDFFVRGECQSIYSNLFETLYEMLIIFLIMILKRKCRNF